MDKRPHLPVCFPKSTNIRIYQFDMYRRGEDDKISICYSFLLYYCYPFYNSLPRLLFAPRYALPSCCVFGANRINHLLRRRVWTAVWSKSIETDWLSGLCSISSCRRIQAEHSSCWTSISTWTAAACGDGFNVSHFSSSYVDMFCA